MNEIIQIQTKFNNIFEFYRDENGIKKCNEVDFQNYFYVREKDIEKVRNILSDINTNPFTEKEGFQSIYNEKLIKIVPNKYEFWKFRKKLKELKIPTYEAYLDVYLKYLIQNPKKFSENRRIGIIDIENNMSLDVDNTPVPITAITIYSYPTNTYYTWVLENELKQIPKKRIKENEILYFFKDEKKMMLNFIKKFKEMDFDIICGWNIESFDFAYIINRLTKLDINTNSLSDFCEQTTINVECRKINYNAGKNIFYQITIPGLEIVDMIPVMKRCNCYMPTPPSFSLSSTTQWYLKNERKLEEIGANVWGENIDKFIDYNIHDVYLVKKLVNNYKLINFMYIIQLEIAEVPLRHVTHNSIVLLYYLKKMFPNVMIRDNPVFFKIDDEEIDLKEFYLKLKAATVLDTPIGVFDNVLIYDFSSMYTSIFLTFGISPDKLVEKGKEKTLKIDDVIIWKLKNNKIVKEYNLNAYFEQDKIGIYPQMLKRLLKKREYFKSKIKEFEKNKNTSSFEYRVYQWRSDSIKNLMNSLFGVGAYKNFSIYSPILSASVTSIGRKLINFVKVFCENKNMKVLFGDTDSIGIQVPIKTDEIKLGKELNIAIKNYVFDNFKNINKENYCINFEFKQKMKKICFKGVKKKYFGIDANTNKLHVKGLSLIRHDTPLKIKSMLQKLFFNLINKAKVENIRQELSMIKKEIKKMDTKDIGIELKISKNPNEYAVNAEIPRATSYVNKYLNAGFRAGDIGKMYYIKKVNNLPFTDVIMIKEGDILDNRFEIDYNKMFKKLVLDSLKLFEDVKEFRINEILSENKNLLEFVK